MDFLDLILSNLRRLLRTPSDNQCISLKTVLWQTAFPFGFDWWPYESLALYIWIVETQRQFAVSGDLPIVVVMQFTETWPWSNEVLRLKERASRVMDLEDDLILVYHAARDWLSWGLIFTWWVKQTRERFPPWWPANYTNVVKSK